MLQIQSLVIRFTTSLQSQLAAVEARDAKFANQLRRSLLSVGLSRSGRSPASWTESTEDHGPSGARERPTGVVTLGEGYGASGGEKRRAYRVARAEAAELEMGLETAVALTGADGPEWTFGAAEAFNGPGRRTGLHRRPSSLQPEQ